MDKKMEQCLYEPPQDRTQLIETFLLMMVKEKEKQEDVTGQDLIQRVFYGSNAI